MEERKGTSSTTEEQTPLLTTRGEIPFISCRVIFSVIAWLGFFNVYALRVNLSVALVSMVNSSYAKDLYHNTSSERPEAADGNSPKGFTGEFNWDKNLQGQVLGAFFYGYIITQVPGGWLAERYGGKILFGCGVLCTSLCTLITPVAARCSVYFLTSVRVIEGLSSGVTFPAMHAMLGKWSPVMERSKLAAFIYAGNALGTVVSLMMSGWLCEGNFLEGWPSAFYVFGVAGCIWFLFWMILAYDSPATHPRITAAEREYIENSIGREEKTPPVPWKSIFTSTPFYAILTAHFCSSWGFFTLLTDLPTYMRDVLNLDISESGMLSALPYLAQWIVTMISGQIADAIRARQMLSTTVVRKVATFLGLACPALGLIAAGYVGCDRGLVVAIITVAVGLSGCAQVGFYINHLDLAAPFAGTLLGMTTSAATVSGFMAPSVVGVITQDDSSPENWRKVFFISAGVYTFGIIIYSIFGSGKEQKWARPNYNSKETEKTL